MFGVAVSTAALIVVLSVVNGFEGLILSLYNSFDPPLKVTVVDAKVSDFESAKTFLNDRSINYSEVLEEKVLLRYQKNEYIATIKGVDSVFFSVNEVDSMIIAGDNFSAYEQKNTAIVGQGVAYYLSMGIGNIFNPLEVYVPNRETKHLLQVEKSFVKKTLLPVGIFSIQADFDAKYVLTSLSFVRELLNRYGQSTALEINCSEKEKESLQKELSQFLGPSYEVKTDLQQHEFLYRLLKSEKLAVFVILSFIFLIATFNIVALLSMLIMDKKKDIKTLHYLGTPIREIERIFFFNGLLTTAMGAMIGLIIGLLICYIQIIFKLVPMGDGSFIIDYFPLKVKLYDIGIVMLIVFAIGGLASWIPSKRISKAKWFKSF